ncbi:transcription repressor ofp6 [Phtheirospermum japonicum]|uniref:Transcription repressor ofp6 n=1 Tax=Phtheirospermum japonicum TaxID=374723 RepID=A0A830BFJ3_9LAMI|nr:transcription repressor ofp6 [Phtheirospermum japonicum]
MLQTAKALRRVQPHTTAAQTPPPTPPPPSLLLLRRLGHHHRHHLLLLLHAAALLLRRHRGREHEGGPGVWPDRRRERGGGERLRRPVSGLPAVHAADDSRERNILEGRSERAVELFLAA